jgi:phospholipase/carboxylesterase
MLNVHRVPATEAGSRRTLFVLHGLGDSHEGWEWLPGELDLPWLNYVLVDAPDPHFGGFSWFALKIHDDAGPEIAGGGVERSRRLVLDLIAAEVASGVPAAEIAVLGFSQGCLMALDAGLRNPVPLAGIVGISGWVDQPDRLVAEAPAAARGVPVLVTHGSHDPLLPIEGVRPLVQRLQAGGFDVVWQEFEKEHTVAGRAEVNFIKRFLESAFAMPPRKSKRGSGGAAD